MFAIVPTAAPYQGSLSEQLETMGPGKVAGGRLRVDVIPKPDGAKKKSPLWLRVVRDSLAPPPQGLLHCPKVTISQGVGVAPACLCQKCRVSCSSLRTFHFLHGKL